MPSNVLVPVDGSPLAVRAVATACEWFPGARVTALYVVDPVEAIYAAEAGGLPEAEGWSARVEARVDEVHDDARAAAADHGAELHTATAVGDPVREILDYAEEHGVDHLVLGSHGRQGVDRAILGSVAERVARRASVPVTVVR